MKPKWVDGLYGSSQTLTLCKGTITAGVSWAVTGEQGYVVRVCGRTLKRTYREMEEGKAAAEALLGQISTLLREELDALKAGDEVKV